MCDHKHRGHGRRGRKMRRHAPPGHRRRMRRRDCRPGQSRPERPDRPRVVLL